MNITFYQFSKRNNSTKIVDTTGTVLSCELKSETDMISPTLVIKAVPASWSPIWNYCYVPAFNRYYFINDWSWINGVWECACSVDVLASWKTEIGNMQEYVLRSSSECNGRIVDNAYLTMCRPEVTTQLLDNVYARALSGGFYVIGIISGESNATQGAITYYQMDGTEFARLRQYLLSNNFLSEQGLTNLADFIPADATKVIYNPYQYIASCQWFPFASSAIPSNFKTAVSTISFGWWTTGTGFSAYRINPNCPVYETTQYKRWQDHLYDVYPDYEYMSYSPYTTRFIKMEPFGEIQIPDDYFEIGDYIAIKLIVDMLTGIGILEVWSATSVENAYQLKALVCRESQQISVDIQLAQIGKDYFGAYAAQYKAASTKMSMATSIAQDAGDVASGILSLNFGKAASASADIGAKSAQLSAYGTVATGDYMKASAPQLLTGGSNGSLAAYSVNNYIINIFQRVTERDPAQLGKPLYQKKTLNTLSGYMLIQNPDVELPCMEAERTMISQYMSGGFFYE